MAKAHFGMIGLGTMGCNFLLNIAEHGIGGVGYDLDEAKRDLLLKEGEGMPVDVGTDLADFLAKLESPRNIMLLVPAGPIVDKVIADLAPHLDDDDLIIDGGNSHFTDTERREAELAVKGIGFMGVGVSGGEEGARHGASIMPGGRRDHYDRIETTLQAVSAKVNGEPCVAYMGTGSSGHFVKMVHNGIEYGMMQLLAETFDFMQSVLRMASTEMHRTFTEWNGGELNSFLVEITSQVLRKTDPETGNPLVSMILDTAGQKGTGKWTSQAAMDFGVPIPTIDSAVTMRQISAQKGTRKEVALKYAGMRTSADQSHSRTSVGELEDALFCAFILTYAQGMSLLQKASEEKGFGLDLAEIARIWRGGCIIRSKLLELIRKAYSSGQNIESLLLDKGISDMLNSRAGSLRKTVVTFNENGIPSACFSSALAYFDAFRTERLPANLIQAQRDFFGAHTYQRIDRDGTFHTPDWEV
ncbi:MAG TPA: NADP-dependent phosphogluconate dehydrogenase [Pyrinomonadaceae bacterium]|nr:NADP-dependent phosphogluconate dehydrogenase [Pyrinomonadaceae bacterium]